MREEKKTTNITSSSLKPRFSCDCAPCTTFSTGDKLASSTGSGRPEVTGGGEVGRGGSSEDEDERGSVSSTDTSEYLECTLNVH